LLSVPDNYKYWNMLFIDPGLNNTGVAIYTVDSETSNITTIDAFTIECDNSHIETGMDPEAFSERFIKLHKLTIAIQRVMMTYNPSVVVCESPFFNRFRPTAYSALVQVIHVLQEAIYYFNPNIGFSTLEPLLIKKHVGAGMMKGKLDVKKVVSENSFIMSRLVRDIDTLDEHAIDAIAIGYAYIRIQGVFYVL
jgi:Holliday junction resolvasome RuvABC endonuclease subunit